MILTSRRFEVTPTCLAEARAFVAATLRPTAFAELLPEAVLATSELATAAINATALPFRVVVEVGSSVRITIEDGGPNRRPGDRVIEGADQLGLLVLHELGGEVQVRRIGPTNRSTWATD